MGNVSFFKENVSPFYFECFTFLKLIEIVYISLTFCEAKAIENVKKQYFFSVVAQASSSHRSTRNSVQHDLSRRHVDGQSHVQVTLTVFCVLVDETLPQNDLDEIKLFTWQGNNKGRQVQFAVLIIYGNICI